VELESRVEARTAEITQLYRERELVAEEKAVADEVARIAASTLDIDQVYQKFAAEVKKLVDFDRISINLIDHAACTFEPSSRGRGLEEPSRRSPVAEGGFSMLRGGMPSCSPPKEEL
jgi:hypothetical protein